MKLSKLNWKLSAVAAVMGAGFFLTACNDRTESEKTSTTNEADSSSMNTNATVSNDSATIAANNNNTANTTTASKPKKGRVSIAMNAADRTSNMSMDKSGYYNYAEVAPFYAGGQSAIEDYVNNNIQYPQDAIDNNVEGTVQVQFGIDEKGNISNVKTLGNKLGYGLEDEAVRVIKNMPKWNAGEVKGKKVKTWMVLPITYKIEA